MIGLASPPQKTMQMNLELIQNPKATPIPSNVFRDNLMSYLKRRVTVSAKESQLAIIRDQIRDLLNRHRENSPNFKIEMWYLTIQDNELRIRFGHGELSQLTVREELS
ncbi:MAG: hypothetical protein WC760_06315 [Bacteroidia bacterium]